MSQTVLKSKVLDTIISLSVLKNHHIDVEYPSKILLFLYYDLKDEEQKSWHQIRLPPERCSEFPEDTISLYSQYLLSRKLSDFREEFLTALANSPLGEAAGFVKDDFQLSNQPKFMIQHASRIVSIDQLMEKYQALSPDSGQLPRLLLPEEVPVEEGSNQEILREIRRPKRENIEKLFDPDIDDDTFREILFNELSERNVFQNSQVLDLDCRKITLGWASNPKSIYNLYGYKSIKRKFNEHFGRFARGKVVRPLLLYGPPGVGKTALTHAFSRNFPNIHLVRSQLVALNELEQTLDKLGCYHRRKIALFIDDIDRDDVQWSTFRRIYEGVSKKAPENVCLIISSNQEFPENVKSRGRYIEFPDITNPQEGLETVLGIILDYIKNIDMDESKRGPFAKFVALDYYHGQAPVDLVSYWDKKENLHRFDFSPRGLLQYLENGHNFKETRARMECYLKDDSGTTVEDYVQGLGEDVGDLDIFLVEE